MARMGGGLIERHALGGDVLAHDRHHEGMAGRCCDRIGDAEHDLGRRLLGKSGLDRRHPARRGGVRRADGGCGLRHHALHGNLVAKRLCLALETLFGQLLLRGPRTVPPPRDGRPGRAPGAASGKRC